MDTGQEYVEMRIGAIPDLGFGGALKSPITSLATGKEGVYNTAIWVDGKGDWYYIDNELTEQLERQDQLQDILGYEEFSSYPVSHLLIKLNEFYSTLNWWEGKDGDGGNITWEQLWLAFVMKEKHNKVWDGKEWLKN